MSRYPAPLLPGGPGSASQSYSGSQHFDETISAYSDTPTASSVYPPTQYNPLEGGTHNRHSMDSLACLKEYNAVGPIGAAAGGAAVDDADDAFSERTASYYGEKGLKRKNSQKKKWIWISSAVVVLALAGASAGIAVWRVDVDKDNKSSNAATTSSSSTSASSSLLQYIPGTAGVVKSDPSDPSDFEKNDAFHVSFYGFAYTPFNVQTPECGGVQVNVTEDIQLLSQLTTRLHTYGSSCNQSQMILQAIKDTKVNITVWLGAYVGTNETVNAQQLAETIEAIQIYGTDNVGGVIIGNEYILDSLDTATAVTYLVAQMATARSAITALGLSKTIPVGTADAGSEITSVLAAGSDFIMANVHPFFGGLPIDQAAGWTWLYFEGNDIIATENSPSNKTTYIGETGWPTNSMTVANMTDGAAVAGVSEMQIFLDTYPCTANTNGTMYFFFEAFDEPWKEIYSGVEPYWGLMDSNKVLKDLTLPTCVSP